MKLIKNTSDSFRNKPTVLAVDDYQSNLVALHAVLGSEYQLITANSGAEAVSIVKARNDIHVILLDIQMPGLDGFQTASEIKRIPGAAEIPIIFITAVYKEDPFVKKGYAAGGVDYFSKPFDPDILKLKIGIYASFRQRAEMLRLREKQVKEAEELMKVGRRLSTVLESLPVGVLISDAQGRICHINDQVSHICERFHPADINSYGKMLGWWDKDGTLTANSGPLADALLAGKSSQSQTIQIVCPDGKQKTVLCSASPIKQLSGELSGAVIALQDITEPKMIEADIEDRISRVVSIGI